MPPQVLWGRPLPGVTGHNAPVRGLYLCGAGTHPGGGVMAASGHNAAQRILKDRKSLRRRFRERIADSLPAMLDQETDP